MRIILVAVLSSLSFSLLSQSLTEARTYFENYEYARAASAYDSYAQIKELPLEDYKRWVYSSYIIGDYKKGLPISDSVLRTKSPEPLFYYINGEINMGLKNYEQARSAYVKYQSLDDEYDVSVKIASCELIPTWEPQAYVTLENPLGINDSKANIVGQYEHDVLYVFKEVGVDSTGSNQQDDVDDAPLVLAQPFFLTSKTSEQRVTVNYDNKNIAISSMAFVPGSDEVIMSVTKPISNKEIDMAPHLYIGKYDQVNHVIDSLRLWEFSGYEDTSACAHPTINSSGTMLVFAKDGIFTSGSDLYYSNRSNGSWSEPKPISKLNTGFDEMYPKFSGDTLLFFSSDGYPGYGGLDIFSVPVNGNTFGAMSHPTEPVNSLSDDFNFVWVNADSAVFSSNRISGHGDDDIYFIGYKKKEVVIEKPDSSDFFAFVNNWKNVNIYFNFDKYDLSKDFAKVDQLVEFLGHYPNSKIIIEGHTDSRGTDEYNMKLGYNRSVTVKDELIKRGIHPSQIETVSKGETTPPNPCDKKCTEADHALNRVAIIILEAK